MPLNYRRGGVTYQINLYDSDNLSWEDSAEVRVSGASKYIQLDSNVSHENASHMRIRKDGTTNAVLHTETKEQWLWLWASLYSYTENTMTRASSPVLIGSDYKWTGQTGGSDIGGACMGGVQSDGTMWTTGNNSSGQLGLGDTVGRSILTQVGSDIVWKQLAMGNEYSMAVRTDGTIWSWGDNAYGQLGLGDEDPRSSPVQIGSDTNWDQVSAGGIYSASVKTDGTLWTWGLNNAGQLGLIDRLYRSSPTQVGSLTDWKQVDVSQSGAMFAVRTNGTLWSWGRDSVGNLGQGDEGVDRSSPTQIGSLTTWDYVNAGYQEAYAIKTDGTLWGWGQGSYGELGQGDTVHHSSPVQIGSETNWAIIGAAGYHWLAVKTDGTLWGCGFGNNGELAQGDNDNEARRSSPVQIGSDTDWAIPETGMFANAGCIKYSGV